MVGFEAKEPLCTSDPHEAVPATRTWSGRRWMAVACMLMAAGMIWLAVPRFLQGIMIAPHEGVFRHLALQRDVALPEILAAATDYERAITWHSNATSRQRLGELLYVAAAHEQVTREEQRALLADSITHLRAALSENPSQPYAWMQLALAELALTGPSDQVEAALRQSIEDGPFIARLAPVRARVGLRLWPSLEPRSRALVAEQVALAAEVAPELLAGAVDSPPRRRLVRQLLADRRPLLQHLDQLWQATSAE